MYVIRREGLRVRSGKLMRVQVGGWSKMGKKLGVEPEVMCREVRPSRGGARVYKGWRAGWREPLGESGYG
jgi:hypothetical protein